MSPVGCSYAFLVVFVWTVLIGIVFLMTWGMAFPLFVAPVLASLSILRRHRAEAREGPLARLPDVIYPWAVLIVWTIVALMFTIIVWSVLFVLA
jgi:hypothetical protein